jgi:hypothetical protein
MFRRRIMGAGVMQLGGINHRIESDVPDPTRPAQLE